MADLQLWKKTNQLQLLISTWYRGSFGSKVQNASFLPKLITKNYTCSSSSFRQKIDLNSGRTTIAASLNAILWYLLLCFSLAVFAGHAFKAGIEYLNLAR